MYTINKITEISMDTSKQRSILQAVNSIVNKTQVSSVQSIENTPEVQYLAETIEVALNRFEELFSIKLNEEQENDLIDHAMNYVKNETKLIPIDLNEDVEILMENNTPDEVFLNLFEISDEELRRMVSGKRRRRRGGGGDDDDDNGMPKRRRAASGESTLDVLGNLNLTQQDVMRRVERPSDRFTINEDNASLKKHKKKIYKITFSDDKTSGVKKGTAVSHKGVMRIVSGKKHFKVYDENNRDVTSQFKSSPKHKKDKK